MTGEDRETQVWRAAAALPIFPLSGALLLPRGQLPLDVFEPRYLNMIEDALEGERMIGMVQPVEPETDPVSETAVLFAVGCVGRITSFSETEDGHNLITLSGACRFRVAEELDGGRGYRRVRAALDEFAGDLDDAAGAVANRRHLLDAVRAYFALNGIEVEWAALTGTADDALVTALAMVCPFDPSEKQALLESPGLAERAELLTALMEMALRDAEGLSTAVRH
jgi:Lon protease-like protein